jgi:CVNH domain
MYRFPVVSFVVLTLAGTLASDAFANGNYQNSCSNSTITFGTLLLADCKTRDGKMNRTAINLDRYIVNDDGSMVWRRNGHFGASCSHPDLDGPRLRAMCKTRDGRIAPASINLGENIANIDGKLIYVGP